MGIVWREKDDLDIGSIGILVSDGSPAEGTYNRHGVLMYRVLINGGVSLLFEDEIDPVKSEEG